ncbi:MAG: ATP-binding protein [Anaerolineales bacterium]
MRSRFRLQTLAARITILVLASLTIITFALGLTVFQITSDWLENTAVANLEAVASARQATIESELRHYQSDTKSFLQPILESQIAEMLSSESVTQEKLHDEAVAGLRREQIGNPLVEWAQIADLSGMVIVSTLSDQEGIQIGNKPTFLEGLTRFFISDPFPEAGKIHLELAHPLRDAENNTIAVLIARFSAQDLLAVTGDYTGLGNSGETVLGARRRHEIHFLVPLRFDPNLSEIEPVATTGERAKPMIHATAGQSGVTRAPDYRDVRVIAAYRPIQLTGWGLVVKQDEQEAFAGIGRLRTSLLTSSGVLLLLSVLITLPLVNASTRQLRELEEATRRVASGDLSVSIPISQLDEVGQVGEAFNRMVSRLREAYEELAASNQELASFAYVVSHDLKAPLRGIDSLAKWLEEDLAGKLADKTLSNMRLLRTRVERMHALIDGLLEYSRIGRFYGPDVRVDIDVLLLRVIDILDPPEHIRIEVDSDMPSVAADELRLSQVFQNLIENAVKYHPGPSGKVKISWVDSDTHWEFSVKDDGEGIEPRYHERIFQIFHSLQSNADAASTGIGLALVRKIVEDRGGRVWVVSKGVPGEGSTFRFTWPKTPGIGGRQI